MRKDLDAKRRARSESLNMPHEVIFGGETFSFPAVIPLESIELIVEGKYKDAFRLMLDDPDQVDQFFAHRPDSLDLDEVLALYPGESSASPDSFPSTGNGSRPTSKRATTLTSQKRATDLQPLEGGDSSS